MKRTHAADACEKAPTGISPLAAALLGAIIVAGIASFAGSIQGKFAARQEFTREIADARQILLAIRLHEVEEPLTRIASLDDLVRSGVLSNDKLLYRTLPDGTKQPRWIYFGFRADQEGGEPVIASARSRGGKWIVANGDFAVSVVGDDFWQVP